MALLERVSTLIRANLNDLIDKSENPEKMIKQVLLDMQNQFVQLKTQLAISIADQHMLEKKHREYEESMGDWLRKAERAVDKQHDDLARAALERYRSQQQLVASYSEQVQDQKAQVENLKASLERLEQKLGEAQSKREVLLARHRRSQVATRANRAQAAVGDRSKLATFDRLRHQVQHAEAVSQAEGELAKDDLAEQLVRLEAQDEIEKLLGEIKTRRGLAN